MIEIVNIQENQANKPQYKSTFRKMNYPEIIIKENIESANKSAKKLLEILENQT